MPCVTDRLVPVLNRFRPPPVPVNLIYAQRRIVAPKIRAFIDFAAPRLSAALSEGGLSSKIDEALRHA